MINDGPLLHDPTNADQAENRGRSRAGGRGSGGPGSRGQFARVENNEGHKLMVGTRDSAR